VFSVSGWWIAFGQAEVDHFWHRLAVVEADENVRGLQVAVNDAFLMGVLHGLADLREERQPLGDGEAGVVAILRERHAADVFHHEKRSAFACHAAVIDLGDIRVIHHRQRLPLGFESREDLAAVHARLDELDRHAAADRFGLLGDPNGAHAPFADLL